MSPNLRSGQNFLVLTYHLHSETQVFSLTRYLHSTPLHLSWLFIFTHVFSLTLCLHSAMVLTWFFNFTWRPSLATLSLYLHIRLQFALHHKNWVLFIFFCKIFRLDWVSWRIILHIRKNIWGEIMKNFGRAARDWHFFQNFTWLLFFHLPWQLKTNLFTGVRVIISIYILVGGEGVNAIKVHFHFFLGRWT